VTTKTFSAAAFGTLMLVGVGACGGVDTRPAEWNFISPAIFQPNCATVSCHSPATSVSGLDFSTASSGYTSLTHLWVSVVIAPDAAVPAGVPCGVQSGTFVCEEQSRPLVTPYDPQGSRVVNMLRARDAPRMPPDRPLTEADIRLVERWILNGACQSGSTCAQSSSAGGDAASSTDAATDPRSAN
jgi:hypothetical protein